MVVGLILLRVGAGGGAVTARVTVVDTQPVLKQGAGLVTTTATVQMAATSAASTATVAWVVETTVVARITPPMVACIPLTKPAPVTVRAKSALPAATPAGVRLVTVGVGLRLAMVRAGLLARRV